MSALKDYCDVEYGKSLPEKVRIAGASKVFGSAGLVGTHKESLYNEPLIVVGRKGNISGVHKVDGPSWVIDTAYAIRAKGDLQRDYLFYFLKFHASYLASMDQSTAIPSLAREVLYSLPLVPPTTSVQKKVVNKIEVLFSEVDAGLEELKSAKANLDLYKQSVLNAAIQGKLVPQNPKDEPASKLLERIRAEKEKLVNAGKIKKEKPLAPILPDEVPFEIPSGWTVARGLDVFEFVTSGSRGWGKYRGNEGALFLGMGNLDHGNLDIDFTRTERVKLPKNVEGARTLLQKGDILISITADVGMVGIVQNEIEEAYINQHVALARPFTQFSSSFLGYYLNSSFGLKGLKSMQRGATKVGLGLDDIRETIFPMPPRDEQEKIVSKLQEVISEIKPSLEEIELKITQCSFLKQSILKSAFEGTLV